jgi:hypothetical protein
MEHNRAVFIFLFFGLTSPLGLAGNSGKLIESLSCPNETAPRQKLARTNNRKLIGVLLLQDNDAKQVDREVQLLKLTPPMLCPAFAWLFVTLGKWRCE